MHSMKRSKTSSFGTVSRIGHDSSKFYSKKMYSGLRESNEGSNAGENALSETNIIYCADSTSMNQLPDRSVHLMVTSPPYNVGKEYDEDLSLQEYKDLLEAVLSETFRVLVDGGRACVNIANVGRTPYIPLHSGIIDIAQELGYLMRGEIIWNKGASAGTSCAWGSWMSSSNPVLRDVHEYILVFSKGSFKRHPIGENTIGRDEFLDWTKSIWTFPAASAKKANHPAPFPIELPKRIIHMYSYAGDIVLDPFMGSGTTAEAAILAGRQYIGYEIDENYVEIAREKLKRVASKLI